MRGSWIIAAALMLGAVCWVWPYLGISTISRLAEAHDSSAVLAHVDLPALRRSLYRQIVVSYLRQTGREQEAINLEVDLRQGWHFSTRATPAFSYVEQLLAPEALTVLLADGHLTPIEVAGQMITPDWQLPKLSHMFEERLAAVAILSFPDGLRDFVFHAPGKWETGLYGVHVRREGATWMLSGVDLPLVLVDRIAADIAAASKRAWAAHPAVERLSDGHVVLNVLGVSLHFGLDDVNSLEVPATDCDGGINLLNRALRDERSLACLNSYFSEQEQENRSGVVVWAAASFYPNSFDHPVDPQPFLNVLPRDVFPVGDFPEISIGVSLPTKPFPATDSCDRHSPGARLIGAAAGYPEYRVRPEVLDDSRSKSMFELPATLFRSGLVGTKLVQCGFSGSARYCRICARSDDGRISIGFNWSEQRTDASKWADVMSLFGRTVDLLLPDYLGRVQ